MRRFRGNVGHPSNDELTRCLAAGGTRVAQRAVECFCERSTPRHRPSCIPTDGERFNEGQFLDSCDVVAARESRGDQHADFSVIAPCPSHEIKQFPRRFTHWIRWARPTVALVCDGERGLGASEIFTEKLSILGTQVQTTFSVAEGSSSTEDRNHQGRKRIKRFCNTKWRGGAPCQLPAARLPTR